MPKPLISPRCFHPARESLLKKILRRCGAYYQSSDLFYHRLWYQHLSGMGFRVTSIEKQAYHEIWDIRLYGTLTAQSYLLLTVPIPKRYLGADDILAKQLQGEIQRLAKGMGAPIRRDCIEVVRKGIYLRVILLWPMGKPGRWAKPEKKAEAFSFLIQPWLRRNRN